MSDSVTNLQQAFIVAVEREAEAIKEQAIQRALTAYEADLRQAVGRAAIGLSEHYDMRYGAGVLTLSVRIKDVL